MSAKHADGRRWKSPGLALSCLVAATSCGGADRPDDLSALPVWQLVEDVRIGAVDGGDQNLTRVNGLLPLPDGRVWIMQPDDHQFRIYDAAGAFVRTVGAEGSAPGEFRGPRLLGWLGEGRDTIWVLDGTRRISLMSREGEFLRSFDRRPFEHEARWEVALPDVMLSDGTALGIARKSQPEELGDNRIVHYDPETGPVYRAIATIERWYSVRSSPTGSATRRLPIPDNELYAYAPDGSWLVVADRRAEGMPEAGSLPLRAIAFSGDTLWARTLSYQPLALLAEEIDTLNARREAYRAFLQDTIGLPPAAADERSRLMTQPGHRPAVERVVIGQDHRIWLEWAASPGQAGHWTVISRQGEPIATLRHHDRVDVLAADAESLWVLELDPLDVPYVVRYRVVESGR
jgi:hypothetical protein